MSVTINWSHPDDEDEDKAAKEITVPWLDSTDGILGNGRPKTLDAMLDSRNFWLPIFKSWCYSAGVGGYFQAWEDSDYSDKAAREELKDQTADTQLPLQAAAGTLDVRKRFYKDMGWVKTLLHARDDGNATLAQVNQINPNAATFDLDY